MRKRKILIRILLAVGILFGAMALRQMWYNQRGSETYQNAARLAFSGTPRQEAPEAPTEEPKAQWIPAPVEEEDPHLEELKALDLEALRQVNPDVIGWVRIPQTRIDYPVLQGEDNEFYLKHTWEGKPNGVGAIFMEHQNLTDLTDFNTILYGHNMNDGSMFAQLKRFASKWQWERSPYVYLATDQGVYRYEIFSAYQAKVDSIAYRLSFRQADMQKEFLVQSKSASQLYNDVAPEITDRILTLSTCSGNGYTNRWIVQARLKMIRVQ